MNAIITNASIDLQGRAVSMKLVADMNGILVDMECGSSVDEIILAQSEKPMSLFEALVTIASRKLNVDVSVPNDLSEYLINL